MTIKAQTAQTERQLQATVIDYAQRCGWHVAHFSDSRRQIAPGRFIGDRQAAGFPDLVLARERVVFAELKREKGRVTPVQADWLDALERAGAEVYVWRPSSWAEIQDVLGRAA